MKGRVSESELGSDVQERKEGKKLGPGGQSRDWI